MNFSNILTEVVKGAAVAAVNLDSATAEFKKAPTDTDKALVVATSLVSFLEELQKVGA